MLIAALLGQLDDVFRERPVTPAHQRHYFGWLDGLQGLLPMQYTFLPGRIYHLYHGELSQRRYKLRPALLTESAFDPELHISRTPQGVWRWTDEAGEVRARLLSPHLAEGLARSVVVENRAGADGTIGANHVARADPDGSRLLLSNAALAESAANPELRFDPRRDLRPVIQVAISQYFLVANADLGVRDVIDLRALARQKPKGLNCGGAPGAPNLGCARLRAALGDGIETIPYQGIGPVSKALISAEVDVMIVSRGDTRPADRVRPRGRAGRGRRPAGNAPVRPRAAAERRLPGRCLLRLHRGVRRRRLAERGRAGIQPRVQPHSGIARSSRTVASSNLPSVGAPSNAITHAAPVCSPIRRST
jgi:hypothetical protein